MTLADLKWPRKSLHVNITQPAIQALSIFHSESRPHEDKYPREKLSNKTLYEKSRKIFISINAWDYQDAQIIIAFNINFAPFCTQKRIGKRRGECVMDSSILKYPFFWATCFYKTNFIIRFQHVSILVSVLWSIGKLFLFGWY